MRKTLRLIETNLQEKASIDWNNYLKPEEVTSFLNKDDKIESAENIVYSNEFKDRYQEFKKSGWDKRELVQDLAKFYENGHLNEAVLTESIPAKYKHMVDGDIYKTPDNFWMIDLKAGYVTAYGTNYIKTETKADAMYELANEVYKVDEDDTLTEGIHLLAFVKAPGENRIKTIEDNDYSSKKAFINDLKANEYRVLSVSDNRDLYVADNSNFGNISQLKAKMLFYRKMYLDYKSEHPDSKTELFKNDYLELKKIYDEAMKISL